MSIHDHRMQYPRQRASAGRRSAAKHEAILGAAAALVSEVGYRDATIEAIAGRAGVAKQTVYRWWPGKGALFAEVYAWLLPADALAADTGTIEGDLRRLLTRLFRRCGEGPAAEILAGLIAESQHDPEVAAALESGLVVGRCDLLAEPFERAKARGELPARFDAVWAHQVVVAMVWHAVLTDPDRLGSALAGRIARLASGIGRGQ